MKLLRRETTIEDYSTPVHVIEYVIHGEENAVVHVALYMQKHADENFLQMRGDEAYWGQDWEETDYGDVDEGETTFYLESTRGNIGESTRKFRALYLEAKRAVAVK